MKQEAAKYIQVYQVIAVSCANCKQGASPNKPMYADIAELVPAIGATLHNEIVKETKVICANPKLAISTMIVFLDAQAVTVQGGEESKIGVNS